MNSNISAIGYKFLDKIKGFLYILFINLLFLFCLFILLVSLFPLTSEITLLIWKSTSATFMSQNIDNGKRKAALSVGIIMGSLKVTLLRQRRIALRT